MDSPSEDRYLIRSCIGRDPEAWRKFVERYSALILSSIRIRLSKYSLKARPGETDDIIQEVLSQLWEGRKLEELRSPESLKYWLSIVSGNTALRFIERRSRVEASEGVTLSVIGEDGPFPSLYAAGAERSLPGGAVDPLLAERLNAAVRKLPARERLLLKLAVLHGKTHEEIAEMTAIPAGTVSSGIRRAKATLRAKLGKRPGGTGIF
jgi:RNA polymerase sigma-70 factor (ECF subfamily)